MMMDGRWRKLAVEIGCAMPHDDDDEDGDGNGDGDEDEDEGKDRDQDEDGYHNLENQVEHDDSYVVVLHIIEDRH